MQLHTLLGMKARVHVHPCAYSIVYRCSFIPCWAWRQEFMCIYMHFCMVLRAGCDEIYRDILWIIMSHIVLWLKLWIYDMWPVWVFGFWFDVVVVKLTWEAILFLVKWVMVWLKGQWRCYMHFLTFLSPSITLNIFFMDMIYIHATSFSLVVMATDVLWLLWVTFYCSIRIINYSSWVTHYKLMLCFHTMIT